MWKVNNPWGWETFKTLTDKAAAEIEEAIANDPDIDKVIKKINVIETKIKFKSFGKTTVSSNKVKKDIKCLDPCKICNCNRCKNQKEKDEELIDKRTKQIEEAVLRIKESRQGRAGNIFKMKKRIGRL